MTEEKVSAMFPITRYKVQDERLVPYIKFYWYFEMENATIFSKLLPTDCIDVLLNLSGAIIYKTLPRIHAKTPGKPPGKTPGKTTFTEIAAPPFHINGLRSRHSYIVQNGPVRVFGISFYSYGLYPFVHEPMEVIRDKIVDLHALLEPLAGKLERAVASYATAYGITTRVTADVNRATADATIAAIEAALCSELRDSRADIYNANLIREFLEADERTTIRAFCDERGVNVKTFERTVERYTAYLPKLLRRINRFQAASNQTVQRHSQLSDLAYDNGFADQAHLTKEFQRFSGAAPRVFSIEKATFKENSRYEYK